MKRRFVRILLFTLTPLLLTVGALSLLTYRQMRQDQLNQTLIAALKTEDYSAALLALHRGADARTRDFPPDTRSFWQRLLDRLYGNSPDGSLDATTTLDLLIESPTYTAWSRDESRSIRSASHFSHLTEWKTLLQALMQGEAASDDRDQIDLELRFRDLAGFYPVDAIQAFLIQASLGYGYQLDAHSEEVPYWLDASVDNPNPDVTAFLLDRGMNPDSIDEHGMPLLLNAVNCENRDAVKTLLDRGASVNTKDTRGNNALSVAEKNRKERLQAGVSMQDEEVQNMDAIIALLKAHGATSRSDR